jgi:hypothetical protein
VPRRKWTTQADRQGTQQLQRVGGLIVTSVAPALQLNPSKAIWRPSMTFSGCLYSTEISSLYVLQRSTVLSKRLTPASTAARCHCVRANQAPGSIYADTFLCNILRILFAFRPRALNPCHSAIDVDCRHWWRTSTKVTIAQGCAREFGRGRVNMRLPCIPSKPLTVCSRVTGRSWKGWKFSSTWDGSLRRMMPTPRRCG